MDNSKWIKAGTKLRECRKSAKLPLYRVALRTHISRNYLSMIERGQKAPSDAIIFNLADFYGLAPAELFELYDRAPSPNSEKYNSIPSLKKILARISLDPKLTDAEKEEFAEALYKQTLDYIKEKEIEKEK